MIGVYDYTVILTYLSLLSGCTGMFISMSGLGHPYIGMLFMLFSGLCDAFDGRVARTKKNRTELEQAFGVQIDSLSDLVAFGVLPASVGVSMLRASQRYSDVPHRIAESGKMCWYPALLIAVAVLYVLAAMIRLAYFNATEDERKQQKEEVGAEYFTGLPVTTAALVFPLVLLLPGLMRLLGFAPLLGIELVQAVSDVVAFLIAIPIGLSEIRKMERARDAKNVM